MLRNVARHLPNPSFGRHVLGFDVARMPPGPETGEMGATIARVIIQNPTMEIVSMLLFPTRIPINSLYTRDFIIGGHLYEAETVATAPWTLVPLLRQGDGSMFITPVQNLPQLFHKVLVEAYSQG